MLIFRILFVSLLLSGLAASGQTAYADRLDGQIYFKLKDGHLIKGGNEGTGELPLESIPLLEKLKTTYQITRVYRSFWFADDIGLRQTFRVYFDKTDAVDRLINELMRDPRVEYAEHVPLLRKDLTPNDMGANSFNNGTWHLYKIAAQQAWDISTGNTAIRVAIVDDAVQVTHPDLAPNMLAGRDVALGNNNPAPPNTQYSHGTHVAGIVSAASNNGIGVASIGYSIKLIPVKSTNQPTVISHGYEGVTWASNNGAKVINMSWGGTFGGQTATNVINSAFNKGITLVAAAGNDNTQTSFYPAAFTNCIAVASTSSTDAKSSFSNFGTWVDISAPGSNIRSTVPNNAYAVYNGTSMASPLVAGLCGLVLSINPNFTPAQVRNCITSTADNINGVNASYIGRLGTGRINAYQAALCAQGSVLQYDAVVAGITNPTGSACSGAITPSFTLKNNGSVNLTSLTITWQLDNGTPTNQAWTGNLAPQAQTTVSLPVINPATGNHTYSVSVGNTLNGNQTDQSLNNNSLTNNFSILAATGLPLPFIESFESNSFATNSWTITNPDNSSTWELFTTGGTTPGNKSARLPFWSYETIGQRDGLITPPLNFSGYSSISMRFEHAYRRFNQSSTDSLIIYISTNCGNSWSRIFARGENGSGTFATTNVSVNDFVPAIASDWCLSGNIGTACYTINLNTFIGNPNVRIRFEGYNNFQNNLYLDNINISGVGQNLPPVANFSVAAGTDVCVGAAVSFSNLSTNQPSSLQWSFQGGTPATSSDPNPSVTYSTPGTYSVSLTATNAQGNNTKTENNYITVYALPQITASASPQNACAGSEVTLTASGAAEYSWSSGLSTFSGSPVSVFPDGNVTYNLVATDANGCQSETTVSVSTKPSPQITITANPMGVCPGGVSTLTATGAQTYQWLPAPGLGTINGNAATVNPIVTTLYSVRGTASNGCVDTASISISPLPAPPKPVLVEADDVSFVVKNPGNLSGHYPYIAATPNDGWGGQPFNSIHRKGKLIFTETNGADDSLACSAVTNASAIQGQIAVVYRGNCEFGAKAANAQNAGAIACIIINSEDTLLNIGVGAFGAGVTIPVIMIKSSTGARLRNAIASGNAFAVLGKFQGGSGPICNGQSIEFALNAGYASYQWTNGGSFAVNSINQGGWIEYTATDSRGCKATDSVYVDEKQEIGAGNILGASNVFASEQKQYNISPIVGVSYQWTVIGGTILNGQGTPSISVRWDIPGEGQVEVSISNNSGCTEKRTRVVNIDLRASLEEASNQMFSLYPNPAHELIIMELHQNQAAGPFQIIDATGRLIVSGVCAGKTTIDLSSFAPGMYLLQFGQLTERFVHH
jgi:serine protease